MTGSVPERYDVDLMKKSISPGRTAALGVCLAAAFVIAAGLRPQQDDIQWLDNYGDALREARRTGRPIFLEFRCEP